MPKEKHATKAQLTMKRFLTDLVVKDLINSNLVPDKVFTVGQLREISQVIKQGERNASESGDTITLEPLE